MLRTHKFLASALAISLLQIIYLISLQGHESKATIVTRSIPILKLRPVSNQILAKASGALSPQSKTTGSIVDSVAKITSVTPSKSTYAIPSKPVVSPKITSAISSKVPPVVSPKITSAIASKVLPVVPPKVTSTVDSKVPPALPPKVTSTVASKVPPALPPKVTSTVDSKVPPVVPPRVTSAISSKTTPTSPTGEATKSRTLSNYWTTSKVSGQNGNKKNIYSFDGVKMDSMEVVKKRNLILQYIEKDFKDGLNSPDVLKFSRRKVYALLNYEPDSYKRDMVEGRRIYKHVDPDRKVKAKIVVDSSGDLNAVSFSTRDTKYKVNLKNAKYTIKKNSW